MNLHCYNHRNTYTVITDIMSDAGSNSPSKQGAAAPRLAEEPKLPLPDWDFGLERNVDDGSREERPFNHLLQGLGRNLTSTPTDPFGYITTRRPPHMGCMDPLPMDLTAPYAGHFQPGISMSAELERRQLEESRDKMLVGQIVDIVDHHINSQISTLKKEICSTVEADVARNINASMERTIRSHLEPLSEELKNMTQILASTRVSPSKPQQQGTGLTKNSQPTSQNVQQGPSLNIPQDVRPRDVERFSPERPRPQHRPPLPCQDIRYSGSRNGNCASNSPPSYGALHAEETGGYHQAAEVGQPDFGSYPNHPAFQQLNSIPPQMPFQMSGSGFPQGFTHAYPGNPMYPHPYPYPQAVGYGYTPGGWTGGYPYYNVSQIPFPQMGNWGNQFGTPNHATPLVFNNTNNPQNPQGANNTINPPNPQALNNNYAPERRTETTTETRNNNQQGRDRQPELPRYLPKMPTFDGKSPTWSSFLNMFEMRATHMRLSEQDKLEKIILCLTGKAIDFYMKLRDQGKCRTFENFKAQMETRFDLKDDAAILQSKFNTMKQYVDEKNADWSERVMTVGYEAFKGLTPDFIEGQLVRRYCSGSQDKEAAEYVLNTKPPTFEEAQRRMKQYRENRITIHGHTSKKVRLLSTDKESPERSRSPYRSRRDRSPRRSSPATTMNSSHDELLKKIDEVIEKKLEQRRKRSKSPKREKACFVCRSKEHLAPDCPDKVEGACYICKETSHRYQDCPKYESENSNRSTQ